MENSDIPENANERMNIYFFFFLGESFFASMYAYEYYVIVASFFFFQIVAYTDCPGTQSESAGKADACEGCPNQQICATAPKGPDPGTLFFISYSPF